MNRIRSHITTDGLPWRHLLRLAGVALLSAGALISANAADVTLLEESFETDGSVATGDGRYTVQGGGDDGSQDYFARRQLGSAGTRVRGEIDGTYMWSIRDIDQVGEDPPLDDLEPDEGRIIWNDVFDVSELGNLRIDVLSAQGSDDFESDNVLTFEVRFDGGDWRTVGGWRGLHTQSPRYFFEGDINTLPELGGPRVTQNFSEWTINVFGTGDTLELRMFTNNNGGSEEGHIDYVRLIGDDGLNFFTLGVNENSFVETDGAAAGQLSITLSSPAPAGGLEVSLGIPERNADEASIASTVTIAEGETSAVVPFDIEDDGIFDADELVTLNVEAEGFARDFVQFTVTNDPAQTEPDVVINEFLPILDDVSGDAVQWDVNNDGFVSEDTDQYVEIVNNENFPVDISGWTVNDELAIRHIFPEGTVLDAAGTPGSVLIGFAVGVGEPRGVFGGAQIQEFSFFTPNWGVDGDIALLRADGVTIDSHAYTAAEGETFSALTRNPDLTGDVADFLDIDDSVDNGNLTTIGFQVDGETPFFDFDQTATLALSVGTIVEGNSATATLSIDGTALAGGLTFDLENGNPAQLSIPDEVTIPGGTNQVQFSVTGVNDGVLDGAVDVKIDARAPDTFPAQVFITVADLQQDTFNVVINEAMANVIGTNADINNNGIVEEPVADQFIEFVNLGDSAVDLSGWIVESWAISEPGGVQVVHVFPEGSILPSNGSLVLFGGGDEAALQAMSEAEFGNAFIQVATLHGNGVNLIVGEDERITLRSPDGHVEDQVTIDEDANEQVQAVTRFPDTSGTLTTLHLEASAGAAIASPGTQVDGAAFPGSSGAPAQEGDNEFTGISTRTVVAEGEFVNLANSSVIIGGSEPMDVVFRGRSVSIDESITADKLPDPIIDVVQVGTGVIGTNDNWADADNLALVTGTDLDPATVGMDANESIVILEDLEPGAYSVRLRSNVEGGTGLVISEALAFRQDGAQEDNELLSISTRSFVGAEEFTDVSNSSVIIVGEDPMSVVFRGRSTSIDESVTADKLSDPIIDVVQVGVGVIGTNDNWADADNLALLEGTPLDPDTVGMDANESILILENLAPGAYSVRVRSAVEGETGLAISEAFAVSSQ